MLSYQQLAIFTAIAEHGSITKASEALNLTQPALSSALSGLEAKLGVKLFDRVDRKIVLNHNGERLYPQAVKLLEEVAKVQSFFSHNQALCGKIRIAASNTIGNYVLPPRMASFKTKYPNVQLILTISNSEQVIEQVIQHQVEIGFIETNCLNNQINSFPFAQDELVLFVSKQHPLVGKNNVSIMDLKDYPFILRERGSGTRGILEQNFLPLMNYQLNIFLELGSSAAVCLAVKNSQAIGCISRHALVDQPECVILTCDMFELKRDFLVVQNKRTHISELTEEWLDWVINK